MDFSEKSPCFFDKFWFFVYNESTFRYLSDMGNTLNRIWNLVSTPVRMGLWTPLYTSLDLFKVLANYPKWVAEIALNTTWEIEEIFKQAGSRWNIWHKMFNLPWAVGLSGVKVIEWITRWIVNPARNVIADTISPEWNSVVWNFLVNQWRSIKSVFSKNPISDFSYEHLKTRWVARWWDYTKVLIWANAPKSESPKSPEKEKKDKDKDEKKSKPVEEEKEKDKNEKDKNEKKNNSTKDSRLLELEELIWDTWDQAIEPIKDGRKIWNLEIRVINDNGAVEMEFRPSGKKFCAKNTSWWNLSSDEQKKKIEDAINKIRTIDKANLKEDAMKKKLKAIPWFEIFSANSDKEIKK